MTVTSDGTGDLRDAALRQKTQFNGVCSEFAAGVHIKFVERTLKMVCGRFLSLHQRLADAAIRQAPRSQSSHLACEQVRTIVEQDYPEGWRARLRQHRRYLAGTGVVVAKGRSASMTQALPPGWPDH